ncbi:MAG: hypothetical protein H0W73_00075 [Bacteroidetes bacterium]|nr:hypothetical protein [Bacteroidota bacterium]
MCGIVGIYKLDNSTVDKNVLSVMTDVIEHRGADGAMILDSIYSTN